MTEAQFPKRSGRRASKNPKPIPHEGMLRVATYTRISTDEQNQPYSLQAQARMLEKYIESQPDMVLVTSYTDQKSGATLDRPELRRLLADANRGAFDLVLVYRLDRLARSIRLVHEVLEALAPAKVGLRSATEAFDTVTAGGRMMMNILAVFAQFERDVMIDRITAGVKTKAMRGEWPGGAPPFGYRIKDSKVLEIVDSEAAEVRRMFTLIDEDRLGSPQIAATLNTSGSRTRTGQLWSFKAVLDVLRRPTYAGWIVHHDDAYEGKHERIIDRELFDRVQAILDTRAEHTTRQTSSEYVLSGLLRCSVCGHALAGVAGNSRSGRYRYYMCTGRVRRGTVYCAADRVSAEALETLVRDQIVSLYSRYDLFEAAAARAAERRDDRLPVLTADLTAARNELRTVEIAIGRYFTAFEEGTMTEAVCADRVRELHTRAEIQRSRIAELELEAQTPAPKVPSKRQLKALSEQIKDAIERPATPALRAFLAAVIDHIEVGESRNVRCFLRVPDSADGLVEPPEETEANNELGPSSDPSSHPLTLGGAGGNRTPVHQALNARATTIPDSLPNAGRPAGRLAVTRKWRPANRLSESSSVFPDVSRLSCCHPPLLLPGCGGSAPCAISGHDVSSLT